MNTQCNSKQLHFQGLGSQKVIADFDGGTITSDAGALLLREIESANHFVDDFARCFSDQREQGYVEHSVKELIAQRTIHAVDLFESRLARSQDPIGHLVDLGLAGLLLGITAAKS